MRKNTGPPRPLILYHDDSIVLIDKPAGLLVHTNTYDRRSITCVHYLSGVLHQRVYSVHRLDRATSGAMVFTKQSAMAGELSRQLREGEVGKIYLALVRGHVDGEIEIDEPLRAEEGERMMEARTVVRLVASATVPEPAGPCDVSDYSLVQLDLLTGRRHQARRHLNHIGRPVIGDNRHGDRPHNAYFSDRFGPRHMFLRSYRLTFRHPETKVRIELCSGVPRFWFSVLEGIGMMVPEALSPTAYVEINGERESEFQPVDVPPPRSNA